MGKASVVANKYQFNATSVQSSPRLFLVGSISIVADVSSLVVHESASKLKDWSQLAAVHLLWLGNRFPARIHILGSPLLGASHAT